MMLLHIVDESDVYCNRLLSDSVRQCEVELVLGGLQQDPILRSQVPKALKMHMLWLAPQAHPTRCPDRRCSQQSVHGGTKFPFNVLATSAASELD